MFQFFNKGNQAPINKKEEARGFTLVELIVTFTIMGLIIGVLVRSQNSYTETIALTNVADQMSITLKQAQAYGTAVKELTPGSANFSTPYGVSISLLPNGSPTSYISFADKVNDGVYNYDWACTQSLASECIQKTEITQGNSIQYICLLLENGAEDCTSAKRVDISYARPRTEARIVAYNSTGFIMDSSATKAVKVRFYSSGAQEKVLVAYKVGQISVVEPGSHYPYPTPSSSYPTPPSYFDLTISKLGTGGGTVTGTSINCGGVCSASYVDATAVLLTATPNASSTFSGWGGGNCTGTGGCPLTMGDNKLVDATFTLLHFNPDLGASLHNNLVAYWKMNESSGNRNDSIGGSTLTSINAPLSTAGKKGNAARFFSASSRYFISTDNAALSTGDISFTLAGWMYLASRTASQAVLAKYQTATVREYWLGFDATLNRIVWNIYNAAGTRVGNVTANNFGGPNSATWYFVIVEHNAANDTLSISINNGTPNSAAMTGVPADTAADFRIGYDNSGANYMDGNVDEWGMWKRLLTAQEKADLYNGSSANTYTP